jgi:hypothetical protein
MEEARLKEALGVILEHWSVLELAIKSGWERANNHL